MERKGQRSGPEEKRLQGHWLLAKMGKRVLRPGGVELTRKVIAEARPVSTDRIIEFGPGVGRTAELLLAVNPASYVGVDPNTEGAEQLRAAIAPYPQACLHPADARDTGLPDSSADLVVGEAMLTMQSDAEKLAIMGEAFRLLVPGGRYAIHEMGFCSDITDDVKGVVEKSLSRAIKVGARPLTLEDWSTLLESVGFRVLSVVDAPMHLLEPKRIVSDEGVRGTARFVANMMRNRAGRERVLAMRKVFRRHGRYINAVGIVAVKPE